MTETIMIKPNIKLEFDSTIPATVYGHPGILGITKSKVFFIGQNGCKYSKNIDYGTRLFIQKINRFKRQIEFCFDDDNIEISFVVKKTDFIKLVKATRLLNSKNYLGFSLIDKPSKYDGIYLKETGCKYYKPRKKFDPTLYDITPMVK